MEKGGQHLGLQSVWQLILLPSLKNFFAASPTSWSLVRSSIRNHIVVWLATFPVTYKRQIKLINRRTLSCDEFIISLKNEGKNLSVIVALHYLYWTECYRLDRNRKTAHENSIYGRQGCKVSGSFLVMWKVLLITICIGDCTICNTNKLPASSLSQYQDDLCLEIVSL